MFETLDGEVGPQPTRPTSFRWSHQSVDDAVVIRLSGEIDLATAPELRQLLWAADRDTAATIVLDLSEVGFIDAYSIGVILHASTAAEVRGRVLQVQRPRGLPARVFRILGLESALVGENIRDCHGDAGG